MELLEQLEKIKKYRIEKLEAKKNVIFPIIANSCLDEYQKEKALIKTRIYQDKINKEIEIETEFADLLEKIINKIKEK